MALGVTITKFGRNETHGYLEARVTVTGRDTIYLHRRYGSWMAPKEAHKTGEVKLHEVEGVIFPRGLAIEVKDELATKARALEKAERLAAEKLKPKGGDDNGEVADQTEPTDTEPVQAPA